MPAASIYRSTQSHHRVCVLHEPALNTLARCVADLLSASLPAWTVSIQATALELPVMADADACITLLPIQSPDVDAINMQLEQIKMPTLFVACGTSELQIGPWCHYGHTACPACVASIASCFATAHAPDEAKTPALDQGEMARRIENTFTAIFAQRSPLIDGAVIHYERAECVEYVLKDPLCPVCSIWSRQPMEALYAHHG